MKRIFVITLFILLISNISFAESSDKPKVPILSIFKNKIVYTMEVMEDTSLLESDCQERGGIFNECGSICDESSDEEMMCPAVCAYTCELGQTDEQNE